MNSAIISFLGVVISAFVSFYISKKGYNRNYYEGKVRIFDITHRYFYVMWNSFEKSKLETGFVLKEDPLSTKIYILGMQSVYDDLKSLMSNFFMQDILKENTFITAMLYRLQGIIITSKAHKEPVVAKESVKEFIKLFRLSEGIYTETEWKFNEDLANLRDVISKLDNFLSSGNYNKTI